MRFEIDVYNNTEKIDQIVFNTNNSLFCWFFFETFDAYETINKTIEREYNYEDLLTCRSRLLYYFEEDEKDLIRYVELFKSDYLKDDILDDSSIFERKDLINQLEIGFTAGYILKFLDNLISLDETLTFNFKTI